MPLNRREFIKSLFAAGVLATTGLSEDVAIEQFLTETSVMNDEDFVAYVRFTANIWVNNPRQCVVITNIVGDED